MMPHPLYYIVLLLVTISTGALAETVYVIDKLLVGVHQDQDLNSAIIKVLPTGTRLEVERRDGELALITDPEGTTGWVDSAYLMEDPPAQIMVNALTEENAELTDKLKAARSGDSVVADPETSAQRDKLMKENTELKRKLSAEKIETGALQAKVASLEARVADKPLTPADTIIADLESSNQKLMRELETVMQTNSQLESDLADIDRTIGAPSPAVAESISRPLLFGAVIGLILAFGGGIYFMDTLHRRRHGGFRV